MEDHHLPGRHRACAAFAPDPYVQRGGGATCDCWITPDASYTTIDNNSQWDASGFHNADDGSYGPIMLPFQFYLYGSFYNVAYININGNVSFGAYYGTFSSTGFPFNGYTMAAPFWADVDLRGPGVTNNIVQYKVTPTAMLVNWTNVGYYNSMTDKVNTFQLVITEGTDPLVPNGANVSFLLQGHAVDHRFRFGRHERLRRNARHRGCERRQRGGLYPVRYVRSTGHRL
ncbi:MAG: hypothetical protein IPL77_07275 [Flavobacteriales bacterium]|nr:hypothetical protein [Flavobacteriales bacterium]